MRENPAVLLLRLLARDDMPDSGHVNWRQGLRMGYVSQIPVLARDLLVQTVIRGVGGVHGHADCGVARPIFSQLARFYHLLAGRRTSDPPHGRL